MNKLKIGTALIVTASVSYTLGELAMKKKILRAFGTHSELVNRMVKDIIMKSRAAKTTEEFNEYVEENVDFMKIVIGGIE